MPFKWNCSNHENQSINRFDCLSAAFKLQHAAENGTEVCGAKRQGASGRIFSGKSYHEVAA